MVAPSGFQPFSAWVPDAPDVHYPGIPGMVNIIPRVEGGYGPFSSLATLDAAGMETTDIPVSRVAGMHSKRFSTGIGVIDYIGVLKFGLQARLYSYDDQAHTFVNVSKSGGYNGMDFGDDEFRFTNYGDRVIVALGHNNPIQQNTGGYATLFSDLAGGPPPARDVSTVAFYTVLIDTFESGQRQPYRVRWSSNGNPEIWPPDGTLEAAQAQAGYNDLLGAGALQRIVPGVGGADALIIAERRIWRVVQSPPPENLAFQVASWDSGTMMPASIVPLGDLIYYYGTDGFCSFDGSTVVPIGRGKVDRFFADDFEGGSVGRLSLRGAADTVEKLIYWTYRSRAATDDFNDRVLCYNWGTGDWGNGQIAIDDFGRLSRTIVSQSHVNLGQSALFAVGRDFKMSTLTGTSLACAIELKDAEDPSGSRTWVESVRPVCDAPVMFADMILRDDRQAPISMGYRLVERNGRVPVRRAARYFRPRLGVPAGQTWRFANGFEFYSKPYGLQRPGPIQQSTRTIDGGVLRSLDDSSARTVRT